jgi:hypothetical protein
MFLRASNDLITEEFVFTFIKFSPFRLAYIEYTTNQLKLYESSEIRKKTQGKRKNAYNWRFLFWEDDVLQDKQE